MGELVCTPRNKGYGGIKIETITKRPPIKRVDTSEKIY